MGATIRLLGRPSIVRDDEDVSRLVRGRKSWALLARVLLTSRPVSRREIASELFSDAIDPLGSVRWCLASLRRAIGPQAFVGDPIQINLPAGAKVDVWNLSSGESDIERAGPLLDGIEPHAASEFATWLLVERERVASLVDERLRQEAMVATAAGDYARAIVLAEAGARRRPFEETFHILLAKSLVLDGRPEAALAHVEATERAFLEELGEKPSSALRVAARQGVSSPAQGVAPRAVVEALIQSGVAALSAGAVEAGLDCLRRAVIDSEAAQDRYLTAKSLVELGSALFHSVRGYNMEGETLLRRAAELAEQCGDDDIASSSLCELGYAEAFAGRRPAAAKFLKAALERAGDDRGRLARIHAIAGFNLVDWGRIEEGLSHYEWSLEHARAAGNRRREIWSLGFGGWGQLAANQPESARRWLKRCVDLCDEMRWLAFRPWPFAVLAEARLRLGEEPVSLRAGLEDAFALSGQLGDPCWEAATARSMALTYEAAEDYEPAMRWLATARNHCLRANESYAGLLVAILSDQARIHGKAGERVTAAAIARQLVSVAAGAHADAHLRRALTMLGEAHPHLGEPDRGRRAKVAALLA
jgi:DNA-binding SARP family transcriptional activator